MKVTMRPAGVRPGECRFACAYGAGTALWKGALPLPEGETEAELELPGLYIRWIDVFPAETEEEGIRIDESGLVVLTGRLEDIEEDGTAYFRIGDDNLMFECLGEPLPLGAMIALRTREIHLYPAV